MTDVVLNHLDWRNNGEHLNIACFFTAMYFDFGRPGETIEKTMYGQYVKRVYEGQNDFNFEYYCKQYNPNMKCRSGRFLNKLYLILTLIG